MPGSHPLEPPAATASGPRSPVAPSPPTASTGAASPTRTSRLTFVAIACAPFRPSGSARRRAVPHYGVRRPGAPPAAPTHRPRDGGGAQGSRLAPSEAPVANGRAAWTDGGRRGSEDGGRTTAAWTGPGPVGSGGRP